MHVEESSKHLQNVQMKVGVCGLDWMGMTFVVKWD